MIRFVVFSLSLMIMGQLWAEPAPFRFGVSPQKSASQLAAAWTPFLDYLSQHSGVPLIFSTATDSASFSRRLKAGDFDFCFVNPQQYLLLHDDPGYEAFAREKGRLLKGLLVTHKDSTVHDLAALQGAELAFPSPTSFAASVLPQAELRQAGIEFTPRYVGSHASVYLNVAKRLVPAGGGITRSLELAPPEVRSELRVLLTTAGYTPHAIASHPRIDADALARLRAAVRRLENDPDAGEILKSIGFRGIQVADDRDWDGLRELALPAPPQ